MKATTKLFAALLLFLAMSAAPNAAQAQAQIEIGPRVGYEVDELEALSIGGDIRASTVALPFQINGTFDYYFLDEDDFGGVDVNMFQLTLNGLFELGINNQVFTPYFGPGISLTRVSADAGPFEDSDSELGLNLVGGAEFGLGNLRPFVQAQFTVGGDIEPVSVVGGLLFSIGGR